MSVALLQARIVEALLGFEVTAISCGSSHIFAVTNDHDVFSWGRGNNGLLCCYNDDDDDDDDDDTTIYKAP